ncbi:MAG: hypothetical protein GY861_21145 [bacterium]|nr:hypothetical protein [bacterium]
MMSRKCFTKNTVKYLPLPKSSMCQLCAYPCGGKYSPSESDCTGFGPGSITITVTKNGSTPVSIDFVGKTDSTSERHSLHKPSQGSLSLTVAKRAVREYINSLSLNVKGRKFGEEEFDLDGLAVITELGNTWDVEDCLYDNSEFRVLIWLDFSPSCSYISKSFYILGKAALDLPNVTVAWGAYEGYVEGIITHSTKIDDLSYTSGDITLNEYLNTNKDFKFVVILGDFNGTIRFVEAHRNHKEIKFKWFNNSGTYYKSAKEITDTRCFDMIRDRSITMFKDEDDLIRKLRRSTI